MAGFVVVLGIFVADATYRADRLPVMGETLLGHSFSLGPGGKGGNQAVASARAGAKTHFITKLGQDTFADMGLAIWREAGVIPAVSQHKDLSTGSAMIFVEEASGNNSIIVCPGAATTISPSDIENHETLINGASVFLTQLEQPIDAAHRALEIAKQGGAITVLNPAPAADLPPDMLALCDYITPNESEAEGLTGISVANVDDAKIAAAALLDKGVGTVIVTLGEMGALLHNQSITKHIPAVKAGPVVETVGAGDAFNGAFAAALARGDDACGAALFASAAAGISVTCAGAAASMAELEQIDKLVSGLKA